mmetsp:Transcript_33856/g.72156  ORF Transcript_33856/g.72156 Transcript_33856/m.72156 type:complete len:95 (+) Transcript_33856:1232-1516(+)
MEGRMRLRRRRRRRRKKRMMMSPAGSSEIVCKFRFLPSLSKKKVPEVDLFRVDKAQEEAGRVGGVAKKIVEGLGLGGLMTRIPLERASQAKLPT